jgi:hypothetical protein
MQPIRGRIVAAPNQYARSDMLRTILLLIALVILVGIVLVATNVVDLRRESNGALTVKTNDVTVGTTTRNVTMPVVKTEERQVEVPSISVANSQANGQ